MKWIKASEKIIETFDKFIINSWIEKSFEYVSGLPLKLKGK
jgi:hypothetical protein